MKLLLLVWAFTATTVSGFTTTPAASKTLSTQLFEKGDGFFGRFAAFGSGADKDDLEEQWQAQQEILRARRQPQADRDAYFKTVDDRRKAATDKQNNMWSWQTKTYKKGEDPLDEWKKRREEGLISDLDDQYGDPKKIGGIPLPMASFGVGGEFGVGGKFDNGGRFDLRLPYADQGYVDEDSDVMGKLSSFFGGGKKKKEEAAKKAAEEKAAAAEEAKAKKKGWPF